MKLVFLGLFAILILGGGAAGAYFYFQQPAAASVGENDSHAKAKEAHDAEAGDAAGHEFVEIDPLVLPIVGPNGVTQTVSIVVVIEVNGSRNAGKVKDLEPRLKDAFIQELYGVLNKRAVLKGGVLQVGMIKKHLNNISQKVMGEGVIEDVLLQVVQQRPI